MSFGIVFGLCIRWAASDGLPAYFGYLGPLWAT